MDDEFKIQCCKALISEINDNVQLDYNNVIDNMDVEYLELSKIKENFTKKEVLQLFMCIYIINVKIEELKTWSIFKLMSYIKETKDEYEECYEIYYKDLVEYITIVK